MAWLKVQLVDEGPLTQTRSKDLSVRANVWTKYFVESDVAVTQDQCLVASISAGEPPVVVAAIPALGASYSATRPHLRVRKQRVEKETSHKAFVVCEYEDPTDGSNTATLLTKAARIISRPEMQMEAYTIDAAGNKAVNAAGEPFDNPPMRPAGIRVYTIRKYVNAATQEVIEDAWNTNNIAGITIRGRAWAADEAWLFDYSFEEVDGSTTVDATMVIKCKKGGWADKALDAGFRQRDGKEIRISRSTGDVDLVNGERPSVAWPLDQGTGMAKPKSGGVVPAADILTLYPIAQADWTGVPLS